MRIGYFAILVVCLAALSTVVVLSIARDDLGGSIEDLRGMERVEVVLTEDGFVPRDIRINAGTVVTFATDRGYRYWPASNSHPAHNLYPVFDPLRPIEPSETWSFTFDQPGAWGYHDHVRSYFTGTVYVD